MGEEMVIIRKEEATLHLSQGLEDMSNNSGKEEVERTFRTEETAQRLEQTNKRITLYSLAIFPSHLTVKKIFFKFKEKQKYKEFTLKAMGIILKALFLSRRVTQSAFTKILLAVGVAWRLEARRPIAMLL